MEGFSVNEICPLSPEQILDIKNKWLGTEDTLFMEKFKHLPYFDVADRPLLLTQLLFLYKSYGYLPDQPNQIYAKLVNLLLEEWDKKSGIRRDSRYAGFEPIRKADFLAALSYQLTYCLMVKIFKESDLVRAYLAVCEGYNLPSDEARQVAQEIQTHTGIILAGAVDTYEFCHLSLQEYLCASYIVRAPLETLSIEYLSKYAAPLAIAVALSSNSSNWFANLILRFKNLNDFDNHSMASFLSRVLIERPNFQRSGLLGFAILRLFKHFQTDPKICQYLEQMLKIKNVIESLASALRSYEIRGRGSMATNFIQVGLRPNTVSPYQLDIPQLGAFPKSCIADLKLIPGMELFNKQ
jgi:predicted NACHT family NTPase